MSSPRLHSAKPRGIMSLSPRKLQAHRLIREEGVSLADAAARMGCSRYTLHRYVREVDEAIADGRRR